MFLEIIKKINLSPYPNLPALEDFRHESTSYKVLKCEFNADSATAPAAPKVWRYLAIITTYEKDIASNEHWKVHVAHPINEVSGQLDSSIQYAVKLHHGFNSIPEMERKIMQASGMEIHFHGNAGPYSVLVSTHYQCLVLSSIASLAPVLPLSTVGSWIIHLCRQVQALHVVKTYHGAISCENVQCITGEPNVAWFVNDGALQKAPSALADELLPLFQRQFSQSYNFHPPEVEFGRYGLPSDIARLAAVFAKLLGEPNILKNKQAPSITDQQRFKAPYNVNEIRQDLPTLTVLGITREDADYYSLRKLIILFLQRMQAVKHEERPIIQRVHDFFSTCFELLTSLSPSGVAAAAASPSDKSIALYLRMMCMYLSADAPPEFTEVRSVAASTLVKLRDDEFVSSQLLQILFERTHRQRVADLILKLKQLQIWSPENMRRVILILSTPELSMLFSEYEKYCSLVFLQDELPLERILILACANDGRTLQGIRNMSQILSRRIPDKTMTSRLLQHEFEAKALYTLKQLHLFTSEHVNSVHHGDNRVVQFVASLSAPNFQMQAIGLNEGINQHELVLTLLTHPDATIFLMNDDEFNHFVERATTQDRYRSYRKTPNAARFFSHGPARVARLSEKCFTIFKQEYTAVIARQTFTFGNKMKDKLDKKGIVDMSGVEAYVRADTKSTSYQIFERLFGAPITS